MNLLRVFKDETKPPRQRKRCIISCENCNEEREAQYKYYLSTVQKNVKYCKPCKERILAEEFRIEHNENRPLSKCISILNRDGKLYGEFECQSCGDTRVRLNGAKPYTQYCKDCSRKEIGKNRRSHAIVRHNDRLARIFRNMLDRCYRQTQEGYEYYGGRGVTICDEWKEDRTKFYDWALSNGYQEHLTIDKDKKSIELGLTIPIYSPETCTWMTRQENELYKRKYGSGK